MRELELSEASRQAKAGAWCTDSWPCSQRFEGSQRGAPCLTLSHLLSGPVLPSCNYGVLSRLKAGAQCLHKWGDRRCSSALRISGCGEPAGCDCVQIPALEAYGQLMPVGSKGDGRACPGRVKHF